jgi:hypothetical protein
LNYYVINMMATHFPFSIEDYRLPVLLKQEYAYLSTATDVSVAILATTLTF